MKTSEYAKSGVDYSLMEPFKMAMVETATFLRDWLRDSCAIMLLGVY